MLLPPFLCPCPLPAHVFLQDSRLRHGKRFTEGAVEVIRLVRASASGVQIGDGFGLRLHCLSSSALISSIHK